LGHNASQPDEFPGKGSVHTFGDLIIPLPVAPGTSPRVPSGTDGTAAPDDVDLKTNFAHWSIAFLGTLMAVSLMSHQVGGKLKIDLQPEDDLTQARGRAGWTVFIAVSVVVLSLITFASTYMVLTTTNSVNIQSTHHHFVIDADGVVVRAGNAGERAFEAGQGVAASVALMSVIILYRRHAEQIQINCGLLSHFAVRGATIATTIASILELGGILLLNRVTGMQVRSLLTHPGKHGLASVVSVGLTMSMVAIAEELSKAIAVIFCLWYCAGALRLATPYCGSKHCRTLIESPRAMMLAGLAAGCGFMTVENVGYLTSVSLIRDPGNHFILDKVMRWCIMAVRVALNIHPWMTGICCGRIARATYGRDTPSLSLKELAWALWPAVVVHAVFDFSLVVLGAFAMFIPLITWFLARSVFNSEWDAAGELEAASAPTADPSEDQVAAS